MANKRINMDWEKRRALWLRRFSQSIMLGVRLIKGVKGKHGEKS